MKLLSTDIKKVKRLSLKEVKLPTKERVIKPNNLIKVERLSTEEERAYSKIVAIYPIVDELVKELSLVSATTGSRLRKIDLEEEVKPTLKAQYKEPLKPKIKSLVNTYLSLEDLAIQAIKPKNSFTKEEVVASIRQVINANQDKAEDKFNLLLKAKLITITTAQTYHLTSSTPF